MPTYQNQQSLPKEKLKVNTIIHLALLVGQLLFAIVAFSITENKGINVKYTGDPFLFVVPFMAISCFVLSTFMYKQQLALAVNKETVSDKLMAYQTAMIVRCALLQGSSLFGIVTYLISGNLFFLLISAAIILYFITIRPTKDSVATDLNLSYDEKAELD